MKTTLNLALVMGLLVSGAQAQTSFVEDFSTSFRRNGSATTAVWDTTAGEIRLHENDLQTVATLSLGDAVQCFTVDGDLAYAGVGNQLRVVEFDGRLSLSQISSLSMTNNVYDVELDGHLAYVATFGAGLRVVDVSNPHVPVQVGNLATSQYSFRVVVRGNRAYLADYWYFRVVDITDPTNPASIYQFATSGQCRDVAVSGSHAYALDQAVGLRIFSVAEPESLVTYSIITPNPLSLEVEGDIAYVGNRNSFEVIDVSDPAAPVAIGSFIFANAWYEEMRFEGDVGYLRSRDWLHVVDVSDPTAPTLLASRAMGNGYCLDVAGEYAFTTDTVGLLEVIAVSEARVPPTMEAGIAVGSGYSSEDVIAQGNYAYLAQDDGLHTIDITDPESPSAAGFVSLPVSLENLALDGDIVYGSTGYHDLQVIDVSDPTSPALSTVVSTTTNVGPLSLEGVHLYAASDGGGLMVFDVGDPSAPVQIDALSPGPGVRDIDVSGNYAYAITSGLPNFVSFDVSDPTAVAIVGTEVFGSPQTLEADGRHVYVADTTFRAVDVSDPANPAQVDELAMVSLGRDIVIRGDIAFVAIGSEGIQVIDIADPTNMSIVGQYETAPEFTEYLDVEGHYAFAGGSVHFSTVRVFSSVPDPTRSIAQSIPVHSFTEAPGWLRILTTQVNSVDWQVSLDGGSAWEDIDRATWTPVTPGLSLAWRADLVPLQNGYNPGCSLLEIEWAFDYPLITSIVDVPEDQGRQVRIKWRKSGIDEPGASTPVTDYAIYRRVDDGMPTRSLPDGDWDFLTSVPARMDDYYATVVPTLVDSTITDPGHSVFVVRALTTSPTWSHTSPPVTGQSIDNLIPNAPEGLSIVYGMTSNDLDWEVGSAPDVTHFEIHRSLHPVFEVQPGTLVATTEAESWSDSDGNRDHHYRVVAVDDAGNRSPAASPLTVTAAVDPPEPGRYVLHQNTPNPFNPMTSISYQVPAPGGHVTIRVFDAAGRRVRTLVDDHVSGGIHEAVWRGRDDGGGRVGSGVYYCRLTATGYSKTIKLIAIQ